MNKKARKTERSSKKRQLKDRSSIEIASRGDLASFIGVETKKLSYILYKLDRKAAYQTVQIPKSNGKVRTLNAVQGPLKWLQRRTLDKLQAEYKPSAYAHGFVPGKSIITNSALHRRKKLIIKLDMEDFFPSITFPRVRGMFMAPPFNFGREAATTMAQMACLDDEIGALPQGGVLSPYISNMLCRRLDKKLAIVAQENKCRYSRYADDLTFSTNDVVHFRQKKFLKKVSKAVEKENFAINETKTRCLTRSERQIVTGIVINDGVNVNRKYVRNIRAILYNCERNGIESQALKSDGYRDSRSSRFVSSSKPSEAVGGLSEEKRTQICNQFLWHLFGRLEFVRQVVLSNGQNEQPHRYKRVDLYRKLMWRFYELIEKKPQHRALKKTVLRRIADLPGGAELIRGSEAREQIRAKSRKEHRSMPETKQRQKAVMKATTIEVLEAQIKEWAIHDPRFFRLPLGTDLDAAKEAAKKIVDYPAIDREKTHRFLESLRSTDGLGALTHDTEGFTLNKAHKLLNEHYEGIVYVLAGGLRKIIDQYINSLENAFADDGEQIIKVLEDPRIKDAAAELRERTRIGTDENGIKIDEMLGKAIRYARANCDSRKEIEIELEAVTSTTVTTDVDSIRKVLNCIMHSMLKNTKGNKIAVAASIKETASGEDFNRYEITIRDNSDVSFDIDPTREFVNGKLKRALQLANGLCDYHFEAQFKGKRALVNMHSGKKGRSCKSDTKGVVHRLGFWIPKPPAEKENDNSQERPGTRNQQRDDLGSESKKVLILDTRDDRRNQIAEAARKCDGLSICSVPEITRKQYEEGNYDVAFVHENNAEWRYIQDEWASPGTTIVLFSGERVKALDKSGDIIKVSARSLEAEEHVIKVLNEALSR
jgi:RNA-directed DNA polymerase